MPGRLHSAARRTLWRCLTIAVIASMLLSTLAPVLPAVQAADRPATGWRSAPNQEVSVNNPTAGQLESTNGLTLILSEGAQSPQGAAAPPLAATEPLSEAETQAILDRLPPLEPAAVLTTSFRLPEASLPPPTPGVTIEQPFPPPAAAEPPATPEVGALEVLRYAPEGEIPIAPFLNVTFNQPMVPLGTLDQLAAADAPVKLTPELPGVWKWLGTQTLTFEYRSEDLNRFPMATAYTVEVPAGTTSAVGGVLAETVSWTFRTPAPQIVTSYPSSSPQPRDPLLFVSFNQAIDPVAVLATIRATAKGQDFPLRLATDAEVAADASVADLAKRIDAGRWLAFRAESEFPADTTVTIDVGPGTPSAEGPLTSEAVQSFSFTTYGPLRVVEARCAWGGAQCPPGSPFSVRFNNPLDLSAISNALVTAEPAIQGMTVSGYYDSLEIQGATAGRTTYNITLSGDVRDIFGQTLGQDQRFTFTTGNASSFLTGPQNALTTLDPFADKPVFTVFSVNYDRLRVRAYAVTPQDWPAYLQYMQNFYRDRSKTPPGREVLNTVIETGAAPDTMTETNIDLSSALGGEPGHLIVVVDKPLSLLSIFTPDYDYVVQSWVQWTHIGLDAITDPTQMVAWATDLRSGAPLPGVQVALQPSGAAGVTDADGIARLALSEKPATVLVGSLGDDVAILPRSSSYWDDYGWTSYGLTDELRWYVFDDRAMYRPGEEVHVKGWLRHIGAGVDGDVSLDRLAGTAVSYLVMDPQGNSIHEGMTDLNDLGGFDLAFTLPVASNLGYASIRFNVTNLQPGATLSGQDYYHSFQVQEFRRPEFAVTARNETTGPYYLGDAAVVAVSAQYYAGGPLANAETTWNVAAQATNYTPPNWSDFNFGVWTPWWRVYDDFTYGMPVTGDFFGESAGSLEYTARTDATGNHYLQMDFVEAAEPRPYSVQADAVVMDVNRQAWSAATSLLVHPSKLYVGMRSNSIFVEPGDAINVDLIVVDVDGNAVADAAIDARMARKDWEFTDGQWRQVEVDEQLCTVTSAAEPVACSFAVAEGGEYTISATVRDEAERLNRSEMTRWVSGGGAIPSRNVEQETILLAPDKPDYQPGDLARILVQAPFDADEGLLTISRGGIVESRAFALDGNAATLEIPIEERYIPNVSIQVNVNGTAPRLDDKGQPLADGVLRPAYGSGSLDLSVPPLDRTLTVTVTPAAASLAPGESSSLALAVVDAAGQPVADAELAVVVVDEAVLALSNYQLTDPLTVFYASRSANLSSTYGRSSLVLANPESIPTGAGGMGGGGEVVAELAFNAMPMAAPMATAAMAAPDGAMMRDVNTLMIPGMGEEKAAPQPIGVRSNFNPLALFAPAVRTDAAGQATVEYTVPDNLTQYRVMVVAATTRDFGSAETNVTARLPLMVRPSAPRFLNFGDQFQLPVVVQNQTDAALTVDVVADAANLTLPGGQGLRVTVPANDRVEVRFPAAAEEVGQAQVRLAAVAGDLADAATVRLPVYTPATTEAFATYGVIDEGAIAQPVAVPQDIFPQFGGLQISTSSTALQTLTDAVLYLQDYPFACSEQLASRVMSVASLRDVLTAFKADGLQPPAVIEAAMQRDIERLIAMQNFDGGWPVWAKGDESLPFYSIFVTHALQVALAKGYNVPDTTLRPARDYLRNVETYYPTWYSPEVRHTLSAYALYVRQRLDDVDTIKARTVYAALPVQEQSLEAVAWLWQVLAGDPNSTEQVAELERRIANSAVETPGMANFVTSYGDQEFVMLHSNRRTDAIVLDALIQLTPASDLIPKVVAGLMAARNNGRWGNTQENVFVLVAMDDYFNTFENVAPDFVARTWLGDTYVAESAFQGYTTVTNETNVPMSYLVDMGATQDVIMAKDGDDGRLYYRLGMNYAPADLNLDPREMGFVVRRSYEPVDDAADVRLGEDGTWYVKPGARVRVRVNMVAPSRRYHVALVDPLPAGFEIINPALSGSEPIPADPTSSVGRGWWWWGPWYQHQNLRDDRAEAFTTYLWDGVYEYSYVARATTPGEFVVPPAKAEEMYSPEVFGRSGSDRVVIE
jgi:uncharacterized protein YfaS (alpha-2-macroglobulin family)